MSARLGLIGCGLWGRNLLREALALGARVVVADPSAEAREAARSAGADGVFASDAEIPEVDGLLVATPASTHYDVLSRHLHRGVPLFSEKPFTLDLSQAEELIEKAGRRIFVLHVWRYHPAVQKLKELIDRLGTLRWMRTTRTNWTSPRTDCDPVWTLLPHDLSIALEILGFLPPLESATAELTDAGASGLIAVLGSERANLKSVHEVSTRYADKRREIRLHGDDGVAVWTGEQLLLHRGDGRSKEPLTDTIALEEESALRRELAAVLGYLNGGPEPVSGARDALLIARRMHEIRRRAGL